jgi:hypothetical protein
VSSLTSQQLAALPAPVLASASRETYRLYTERPGIAAYRLVSAGGPPTEWFALEYDPATGLLFVLKRSGSPAADEVTVLSPTDLTGAVLDAGFTPVPLSSLVR